MVDPEDREFKVEATIATKLRIHNRASGRQ